MTGAIEFLKHARDMCDENYCRTIDGKTCPAYELYKDGIGRCRFKKLYIQRDEDLADLVRTVENWHRERSKDEKNKSVD